MDGIFYVDRNGSLRTNTWKDDDDDDDDDDDNFHSNDKTSPQDSSTFNSWNVV